MAIDVKGAPPKPEENILFFVLKTLYPFEIGYFGNALVLTLCVFLITLFFIWVKQKMKKIQ